MTQATRCAGQSKNRKSTNSNQTKVKHLNLPYFCEIFLSKICRLRGTWFFEVFGQFFFNIDILFFNDVHHFSVFGGCFKFIEFVYRKCLNFSFTFYLYILPLQSSLLPAMWFGSLARQSHSVDLACVQAVDQIPPRVSCNSNLLLQMSYTHRGTLRDQSAKIDVHWMFN